MKKDIHIQEIFPKYLFWNVDIASLDINHDQDLIIPRALMATTSSTFADDILRLEAIYPKAVIARELKATKEKVSNQVCLLVARRYHIKQFLRFAQ